MSSDIGLGKLITGEPQRDAIHVAVAPVVAGCELHPGQHVGLARDTADTVEPYGTTYIGIVDPFLTGTVKIGQRFWLFLYPGTITSLRHDWTHPAFAVVGNADEVCASRTWLENFAQCFDMDYNGLMDVARRRVEYGEYVTQRGSDSWRSSFWGNEKEFWKHYQIVTGVMVLDYEAQIFSCSC